LALSLTAKASFLIIGKALRTGVIRNSLARIATYLLGIVGTHSYPEVIVYAFRGERRDYFFGIDPRLRFGHAGLSFDGGRTIFGFNPHKPAGVSMEAFIRRLRAGQSFPGVVLDDTRIFILAQEHGLRVVTITYSMNRRDYKLVKKLLESDANNSPMRYKLYSFPKMDIGGFDANCFNCATYPLSLGMQTPYPSGKLADYI
jgi:hypothetical protein